MKTILSTTTLLLIGSVFLANANPKYWDANGEEPGAGDTPSGTWSASTLMWSDDPDGEAETAEWVPGSAAVFSAGTDATNSFDVTLSGTQSAASLLIEEGAVNLIGSGAVAIGGGTVTISPDTALSITTLGRITATSGAGAKVHLGGTLENKDVTTSAPNFITVNISEIAVEGTGTLKNTAGASFHILPQVITGSDVTVRKAGTGNISVIGASTFTGDLIVDEGKLRLRTSNNRFPGFPRLTVNSPGNCDLDGLNQRFSSVQGDGIIYIGGQNGTGVLTINPGSNDGAVFTGELHNGLLGASALGSLTKGGSATLTLGGVNTYRGVFTLNSGTCTVLDGASLCGPAAEIVINSGTLNLSNATQIVRRMTQTGGTVSGVAVLTATNYSFQAGTCNVSLSGDAPLTKTGTGTATLTGDNTYSGPTTVEAGTLRVNNASGSATGANDITVNANGRLSGNGAVSGAVMLHGTIAPGASVGSLATGNQTWNGGAQYTWEINDAAGSAGTDPGWDKIVVTGGLTINATPENKFKINITSLAENVAGDATNFNKAVAYDWIILTASEGIAGFDADAFELVTDAFSNALGSATFALTGDENDLVLHLIPDTSVQPELTMTSAGVAEFHGTPNSFYAVEYSDDLEEPIDWQVLMPVETDGTGRGAFADPTDPLPQQRFYRVATP
jgi:fibronectin-binding autotransporter adhesin